MAPQVSGDLTPKIIDFELGRKALEKGFSEDEQRRATLCSASVCHRSVGTVADDEDVLRLSAEPLRRTRWVVPVLINSHRRNQCVRASLESDAEPLI